MSVRDIIVISILLFAFGIFFFVIKFTADTAIDRIVAIPQINQSTATVAAFEGAKTTVTPRLDGLFFGLFIGFFLAIIITGWFIAGNPIFIFLYMIITVLGVTFSTILANTWQTITTASVFGTTLAAFPITNHILSWLPLYIAVMSFIGVIVMFAKPYMVGEAIR